MEHAAVERKAPPKRLNYFERYLTAWVGLCMLVGVLIEVPVMLSVCSFCNWTRHWFPAAEDAGQGGVR